MHKLRYAAAAGIAALLAGVMPSNRAEAADIAYKARPGSYSERVHSSCREVWRCGPAGCGWRHVCWRGCLDGYSCYPLYGAYGPYGGVRYWGAYSASLWGYR